jgi:acyl carrier protein
MKIEKTVVQGLVYDAIVEMNKENNLTIQLGLMTQLFWGDSGLDSLALVMLIVKIETKVNQFYNTSITLSDDRAMSQTRSPFRTVETVVDYVYALLNDKPNSQCNQ